METGDAVGDDDGFVLLQQSERNRERLRPLAERDETKEEGR
jgi:hypothetical protein